MNDPWKKWRDFVRSMPIEPLFVTISGAHLYGFPSPDSDIDLRGCHRLPLPDLLGLSAPVQTFEQDGFHEGIEVDIVSHDIGKYLNLMVRNNGYILEQVFSPLVVVGEEFLKQLRPLAGQCVTRHHYYHYRGFYASQRRMIGKQDHKRVKQVLYAYRVLMTGIHLMRTGRVEANLSTLNQTFRLPFIDDLIASKVTEKATPSDLDWPYHAQQLDLLDQQLLRSFEESSLPDDRDRSAVNEFLVRQRLEASEGDPRTGADATLP